MCLLVTKGPRTQVMVPECFLMLLCEFGKESGLGKEEAKERKKGTSEWRVFFFLLFSLCMHVVMLEEVTAADL